MAKLKTPALKSMTYALECHTRHEHGYAMTYVTLRSGRIESLSERLAGCANNAAGYENQATADWVARETQEWIDAGHTHMFHGSLCGERVSITWKFQDCRGSGFAMSEVDIGREPQEILVGAKVIQALTARYGVYRHDGPWETPEAMVKALTKLLKPCTTVRMGRALNQVVEVKPGKAA